MNICLNEYRFVSFAISLPISNHCFFCLIIFSIDINKTNRTNRIRSFLDIIILLNNGSHDFYS